MSRAGRDAGAYQNCGGSASRPYTLPYDLHHSDCHHWFAQQGNSIGVLENNREERGFGSDGYLV